MIEADYDLTLNGKQVEVRIVGRCSRSVTGEINCEIDSVLTPDGLNVFGVIPEAHIQPMRARLWSQAIAARHPYGEGEGAAV